MLSKIRQLLKTYSYQDADLSKAAGILFLKTMCRTRAAETDLTFKETGS